MTRRPRLAVAVGILAGLTLVAPTAQAAITSITVRASRPYEQHDDYTYAEITIKGTVARRDGSVGRYSVPAALIYPPRGRGNKVGVVDWLNSAFYHFFPPSTEFGTYQFTLLSTGDYLFDEGYTYLTIQWNKAVTEIFGPAVPDDAGPHNPLVYGTIERSADAWEILLDAARLLKQPGAYPRPDRPAAVQTVLSSGYSQGGGLQLELLAETLDPTRVYDGHLVEMIGFTCWKREDVAPHFGFFGDCGPLPVGGSHAPVMVLASETDMVAFQPAVAGFGKSAFFSRNPDDPNWRQYEMAGVSHLPEPIFPLGVANQNSADPRPIFRAAFKNLTRWARGEAKPPAARYFEGSVDPADLFTPVTDLDGHFKGGVRLPHVESKVEGKVAGAPLGRHTPLNPLGKDPLQVFVILGGTFTRFTEEDLIQRYETRQDYVRRVKRAADHLVVRRYITAQDRKALVEAARVTPLPLATGTHDGITAMGRTPVSVAQTARR